MPPRLPQMETFLGTGAPQSNYIAEPWKCDTQGFLETNIQNNPYYPLARREEYKYIQCGIRKRDTKTYCDNALKQENTALCFATYEKRIAIKNRVARMPDGLALGELELHTPEDIKSNDNHQCPIKYWN